MRREDRKIVARLNRLLEDASEASAKLMVAGDYAEEYMARIAVEQALRALDKYRVELAEATLGPLVRKHEELRATKDRHV